MLPVPGLQDRSTRGPVMRVETLEHLLLPDPHLMVRQLTTVVATWWSTRRDAGRRAVLHSARILPRGFTADIGHVIELPVGGRGLIVWLR